MNCLSAFVWGQKPHQVMCLLEFVDLACFVVLALAGLLYLHCFTSFAAVAVFFSLIFHVCFERCIYIRICQIH